MQQIQRLVRSLVRNHDVPDAPLRAALRAQESVTEITVLGVGSGTIVFDCTLAEPPPGPCVVTICVGRAARVDFPVHVTRQGSVFRAAVDAAPLVLRRRLTGNAKLEEALGVAA